MECGNYRDISVMNTLAKIYDSLIINRLKLCTNIDQCQAGVQQGRGKLLEVLKSRVCGKVMLRAIQAMYACTRNILRSARGHGRSTSRCSFNLSIIHCIYRSIGQNDET